jgi:hypothetical protein
MQRSTSTVEKYFVVANFDEERAPRNYENSNFQSHHHNPKDTTLPHRSIPQQQTASSAHKPVTASASGSTSISTEPSTSLHDGYSRYSLTDIPDFTAQQEDEVYLHNQIHNEYEDPQSLIYYHQPHQVHTSAPSLILNSDDEQKANFIRNQVDVQKYLYNTDTPNEAQNNQAQQHQQQYNPSTLEKRFKKNPNVVKQFQKGKSVPNMQELQKQREVTLPQPFNSQNIHTAVGESVDH